MHGRPPVERRHRLSGPEDAQLLRRDAPQHAQRVDDVSAGTHAQGRRVGRDRLPRGRPGPRGRGRALWEYAGPVLSAAEGDGLGPAAVAQGYAAVDFLRGLPLHDPLLRRHDLADAHAAGLRVGHAHGRRLVLPVGRELQHLRRHASTRQDLRLPDVESRVPDDLRRLRGRLRGLRGRRVDPRGAVARGGAGRATAAAPQGASQPGLPGRAQGPAAAPAPVALPGLVLPRARAPRLLQQLVRHQNRVVARRAARRGDDRRVRPVQPHLHAPEQRPHLPDRRGEAPDGQGATDALHGL
mmetsp:Transcript_243/g.737  ORF Transcript_243/g.737 Transcript_243/m.737 type:complete len:297 (+) Transcript_243:1060-1950(+)